MIPQALTPADLACALDVLRPNLESWLIPIREGFIRTPRDDGYDPEVDGSMLEGGLVLVGRRHLDRVPLALNDLEHQAHGRHHVRVVAALDQVMLAIGRLEDEAPPLGGAGR